MASNSIVGMWKLVSLERVSNGGEVMEAELPVGFLIYTESGWMSEAFEYRGPDGLSAHVLYCGTYETHGDTVIHQPHVHPNAELVGANLERTFQVEGNRFILTAPNPSGYARLVWERLR